ncbi:3-hydroxyacyl-ACP dehydratase FabZ [Tumebacillus permanentifrigoris]|uniref:3-hydroxyacyl-[acyl-carrier-protein] dehydratase n=1 Tax=Tumebacillus permanentifrigoris TaxID=378543 RepID=A0A316DCH8_9BACL|nr:3-hydroxyacyl-ACP dehydratase FabZ [Tumebacillus permanentifrigoris]PWK15857.1 3-hydroxyacyl-[acyl-carrier-protein] dehydratase [Tumebacillus permanentifrigoris]
MKTLMTADDIRKLLPHRWPFLLLDRIIELKPGSSGTGLKNVTVSEPYFEGHFPTESIMPGVLIIEALAQMTAVVASTGAIEAAKQAGNTDDLDAAGRIGYLVAIRDMKFMKPVVPGDQLELKVSFGRAVGILTMVKVAAYVGKDKVVEGTISVSQRPDSGAEA